MDKLAKKFKTISEGYWNSNELCVDTIKKYPEFISGVYSIDYVYNFGSKKKPDLYVDIAQVMDDISYNQRREFSAITRIANIKKDDK